MAGAALGALFASGVLLIVLNAPPARRVSLVDRLRPYLAPGERPTKLSARRPPVRGIGRSERWRPVVAAIAPLVAETADLLDRVVGGGAGIRRRLAASGSSRTLAEFRAEQVGCAGLGALIGAVVALGLGAAGGAGTAVSVPLLAASGVLGGVLGRDWWLTLQLGRRHRAVLAALPGTAELLALAVTAGESLGAALERVTRLTGGPLGAELALTLAEVRAGRSLPAALDATSHRVALGPLARFLDGVVIALERGTPLAEVLRAQAGDIRESGRRDLLAAGGRREIAMMVPVVFLILPVTVLFALYPGLVAISTLAH
jgi:tight adherence protein C